MSSEKETDFELSFSVGDVEAMARSRRASMKMSLEDYLRFITEASRDVVPSRRTSEGFAPFRLFDE